MVNESKGKDNGFILIAIVAVVAVVGIVAMISGNNEKEYFTNSAQVDAQNFENNIVGDARFVKYYDFKCYFDSDCAKGFYCSYDGFCVADPSPACYFDSDCAKGFYCSYDGFCVADTQK